MRLTIHAVARPAPQGSKRGGTGGAMLEQSPYLPAWRREVKVAAYRAYAAAGLPAERLPIFPAGTPVTFELIEFMMIRGEQCAAASSAEPVGDPDIDKLLRSTLDALGGRKEAAQTARLFHDDAQVVEIKCLRKVWATVPEAAGALIIVSDGRE